MMGIDYEQYGYGNPRSVFGYLDNPIPLRPPLGPNYWFLFSTGLDFAVERGWEIGNDGSRCCMCVAHQFHMLRRVRRNAAWIYQIIIIYHCWPAPYGVNPRSVSAPPNKLEKLI